MSRSKSDKLRGCALLGALVACTLAASALGQERQAWLIRLEGQITAAQGAAIQRKIEQAIAEGAELIILELHTGGGRADVSEELGNFILRQEDVRIVAYINIHAYSGGTMVALACEAIYIDATAGMMGDVAPVMMPTGQEMGEKSQSPVRMIMENYAERRGYPIALVQAMVTKELVVHRVKLEGEEEPQYLTAEQLAILDPDIVLEEEVACREGELLTLNATKAVEYGFARKAVTSREALYDELAGEGATLKVKRIAMTPSERVVMLLDAIAPLLLVAGLLLLWHEITHPGFGLPGILGLACLATLFVVKYSLQYVGALEIILIAVGAAFVVIEVFFIPGFGVLGVVGGVLMVAGTVLMFQQFTIPATPGEVSAFQFNIVQVIGAFVVSLVGMAVLLRYAESIPLLSRLVRYETLEGASVEVGLRPGQPGLKTLIGQIGVATTPLRPAGRAEFGEQLADVVTEGDFIEKGTSVEVIAVHGRQVIVQTHREA